MDEQKILNAFSEGFDCSQVVLSSISAELGIDDITAEKISVQS